MTIGYPRSMAAYALFNDLEAEDVPFPRAGCRALFDAWFGASPAITAQLRRALTGVGPQNPVLAAEMRRAWRALGADRTDTNAANLITYDTIGMVGPNPAVTSVYHDPGLPGDGVGPIDIVRIGARAHTYAIVRFDPEKPASITLTSPYCVVGDDRCSSYYVWP